ncbi:MAG TPA: DUF2993 domain-containing protein [Streptosporangiaceae bacterium]
MLPALLIFFVLLVVPAADRLLAVVAARHMARHVARRIAVTASAGIPLRVRIAGVSFLAQLVAGRFAEVRVTVPAFVAGGLDLLGLDARLTQVRAPLRRLLSGSALVAGRVTATTTIALSALDSRLPPGLTLARHGEELRITGPVLRTGVYGTLGITAGARQIFVTPRVLGFPSLVGFAIALPALPPELVIDSVAVTADGLAVTLHGDNVTLGGRQADVTGPAECLAT